MKRNLKQRNLPNITTRAERQKGTTANVGRALGHLKRLRLKSVEVRGDPGAPHEQCYSICRERYRG